MYKYVYLCWIAASFLFSCQPAQVKVDDFFGIKMSLEEEKYFEIAAYDEQRGASYRQSMNMDPDLFAWAEWRQKDLQIKIVNKTENPVRSDYLNDHFIVSMQDGSEFELNKGRDIDYPSNGLIQPRQEMDYVLTLPSRFWETQGMTIPQSQSNEFIEGFWSGLNTVNSHKENIKLIRIALSSGETIILKSIPRPDEEGKGNK